MYFSQVRDYSDAQAQALSPLAKPVLLDSQRKQPGKKAPLRVVAFILPYLRLHLRRTHTQQAKPYNRQSRSLLSRVTHRKRL